RCIAQKFLTANTISCNWFFMEPWLLFPPAVPITANVPPKYSNDQASRHLFGRKKHCKRIVLNTALESIRKSSRFDFHLAIGEMNFGHFETELHLRYPDSLLYIRNMCDGGNTPGFRPHSGRPSPWAFDGAEKFQTELARNSDSQGDYETPDQWTSRHKADIIIAFFGFNESFQGKQGLENYKAELDAFIKHTLRQKYNGKSAPQLAIVSPIAFEDLSMRFDLPNGIKENE